MAKKKVELSTENEVEKRYLSQIEKKKRRRTKRKIIKYIFLFSIVLLIFAYLTSDISKVKSLVVQDNNLYSDEKILEMAQLDYNSSFVLNPSFVLAYRLEKDELIKKAHVSKNFQGGIEITIDEEKVIGYLDDEKQRLLVQGSGIIEYEAWESLIYSSIPRIGKFTESQLAELDQAFLNVDKDMILMISEIEAYKTSYDENMIQLIMVDGNRITTSMEGIAMINKYKDVLKSLQGSHVCLYLEEISGTIFKEADDCRGGLVNPTPIEAALPTEEVPVDSQTAVENETPVEEVDEAEISEPIDEVDTSGEGQTDE